MRTDGYPLYNLAATIDDHLMGDHARGAWT